VCTYTNVAVDNLVEGFVKAGLKPLRIAFSGKVKPEIEEYTYQQAMARHFLKPRLDELTAQCEQAAGNLRLIDEQIREKALTDTGSAQSQKALERLRIRRTSAERRVHGLQAERYRTEQVILQEMLQEAQVVCVFSYPKTTLL
jgi:hypothetical protein